MIYPSYVTPKISLQVLTVYGKRENYIHSGLCFVYYYKLIGDLAKIKEVKMQNDAEV
ncbi:hypothetical protein GT2_29_00230 [Parageobacillus thermoglucosidasius NBRC 107763]|nr:hypothetical protein B4168_3930 [Anoxybacillus flavithermus]OAO87886.1 hypothetical protein GT23_0619 [Parageobacillus thermoglucosidasius]GAJ45213.1 hypothetical protein GT2_29_00230 [Parageobacillus thermoglucosidasius NBRC 107763]